ncbi:MAG TPA: hypothetical protein VIZ18_01490 [Ktedonobacteraceae bacterium]
MFEALFRIVAQVEENGEGQAVFRISEHEAAPNETEFLSLLATIFQQEVYPVLRAGDTLTISAHLDLPPRDLEKMVSFRENKQFVGEGLQQPTANLLPVVTTLYESFLRQVDVGDIFTVQFRVQRL